MTYIEELRNSKDKAQVAYHEFALATKKFSEHLFCFFEGKDNAYYVPRITNYANQYHAIKCNGREKVLGVYNLITKKSEYNKYKKAFFIDQDFNQPLQPTTPPIFETPCYSIENLYVSVEVFKAILANELGLSEIAEEAAFKGCVTLFEKRQKDFHDVICLFNAWYTCLIDIRNAKGKETGAKLDDQLPKDFIAITSHSVTSNYNLEAIKKMFPNATELDDSVLDAKIIEFQKCDGCKVFRGKYEMQFLIIFIRLLFKNTAFKKKIKFPFGDASSIGNAQAINIFSAYAETPESLNDYLRQVTQ